MKFTAVVFILIVFNSCFLFRDFRRSRFSFSENGRSLPVEVVVPKGYSRTESQIDSAGNQIQYYYYSGGTVLYFALMKDTATELQPINYNLNIPRQLYHTIYFKGLDSADHYWRETRFNNYRAGYKNVEEGEDGNFDSSLNYFSRHVKP